MKYWFHLPEDGKIIMPRLLGAMLEIVCINYRIVHFLVLHSFHIITVHRINHIKVTKLICLPFRFLFFGTQLGLDIHSTIFLRGKDKSNTTAACREEAYVR